MKNTNKTVAGSYDTQNEALNEVERLKNEGYQKKDITLYSKDSLTRDDHEHVDVSGNQSNEYQRDNSRQDDSRSVWDKVKDAFTPGSYNEDTDQAHSDDGVLSAYQGDLKQGKIVVVVDDHKGKNLEDHNSSGALLNSNRETNDPNDPLTEGRAYDRSADNKDNFRN